MVNKYFFSFFFFQSVIFSMEPVKNLDIDKFMGKWYVISNIPNFIENKVTDSYDEYTLNSDGTIEIFYHGLKNNKPVTLKQRATILNKENNSEWKLKLTRPCIPFLRLPYKVIILDENYQYMAVGYPKNKYGWIMSRTNKMDDDLYFKILTTLQVKFGYDINQFKKVIHN